MLIFRCKAMLLFPPRLLERGGLICAKASLDQVDQTLDLFDQ